MLTEAEALGLIARHLGSSARASHSIAVGRLMARLAEALGTDVALWRATGLCHDLDYCITGDTPGRHGPLAAEWLADRLPAEACSAIAAHDHRAGLVDRSPIAEALRLADALAVAQAQHGVALRAALLEDAAGPAIDSLLADRPWLARMIIGGAEALQLDARSVAAILE